MFSSSTAMVINENNNDDSIPSGWDFVKQVKLLSPYERLFFAEKYAHKINHEFQFVEVLSLLHEDYERVYFAKNHRDKVKSELANVLKQLPKAEQLNYAKSYDFKKDIQYGYQVEEIVEVLGEIDLEFIQPYTSILSYSFGHIIKRLPQDIRLEFVNKHYPSISYKRNTKHVVDVIESLYPKDRFDFALEHINDINHWSGLAEVLDLILDENRITYLKLFIARTNNGKTFEHNFPGKLHFSYFYDVIKYFPQDEQLNFALSHSPQIATFHTFKLAMDELQAKDKLTFAYSYKGLTEGHECYVLLVLCMLEEKDRAEFLSNYLHRFDSKESFNNAREAAIKSIYEYTIDVDKQTMEKYHAEAINIAKKRIYTGMNTKNQSQENKEVVTTTFTFIRHALSKANVDKGNKIGGRNIESELVEEGHAQAKLLGKYFKNESIQFTRAYSSTARRTKQTAVICFEEMDQQYPIISDPALLEQSAGDWEGQSREIYNRPDVRKALDTDNWNYVPGDKILGESQNMVAERMIAWMDKILMECIASGRNHHIVIFTHGLAIKFLLAELLNLHRPTAYSDKVNPIDNASITELRYQNWMLLFPLSKRNFTIHNDMIKQPEIDDQVTPPLSGL